MNTAASRTMAAATLVVVAAHLLVPLSPRASFGWFIGLGLLTAGAIAVGVRTHGPSRRGAWVGFGLAALLVAVSNVLLLLQDVWGVEAFPSPGQLAYLGLYPALIVAVVKLIRARTPGRDVVSLLDAVLLAAVIAVFEWVFIWQPGLEVLQLSVVGRAITLVYPLLDLVLLTVTLRLAVSGGHRPPAFWLAVGAVVSLLAGDVAYSVVSLAGGYTPGHPVEALWLAALGLLGVVALHPSMVELSRKGEAPAAAYGHRRLALLAGAALLVPLLQATAAIHGRALPSTAAAGVIIGLFALVVARMALLLRALDRSARTIAGLQQQRAESRFGTLIQHSTDIVLVTDANGLVRYATPALQRTLGVAPGNAMDRSLADVLSVEEGAALARELCRLAGAPAGHTTTFEQQGRHADGSRRHLEFVGVNRLATPEVAGLVFTIRDQTDRKRFEEQLRKQAVTDPLTGLANRTLFHDRVAHALSRHSRHPDGWLAVVFLDLDDFKTINDSLGHGAGDDLLRTVATRLVKCLRPSDTAARLGGDEFACLLEDLDSRDDVTAVVERIEAALADRVVLGERVLSARASIGVAFPDTPGVDADGLLRNADTAMYTAKTAGKGRHEVFAEEMHDEAVRRLELKGSMEQALDEGDFRLVYQPIVDLQSNRVVAAEALLRWRHPRRGEIAPSDVVPLAEETGFIVPLGRWVLREACRQATAWQLPDASPIRISVNVSPRQLVEERLVDDVAEALSASGLEPSLLQLELTESVFISDLDAVATTLRELKRLGVAIAVDDFGTGYSSLSYLRDFPVDVLKIDRSFIETFEHNKADQEFAAGVLTLAHHLKLQTLAEGIEYEHQRSSLRALQCNLGQGYLFARPTEAADFTAWLETAREPLPQAQHAGRP